MTRAAILTIGHELLIGQVIDTNAAWLADEVNRVGIAVATSLTVGDDIGAIRWAMEQVQSCSEIVVVTGGLGPTRDDLTREAIADYLGLPLEENAQARENIRARYASWGRTPPDRFGREILVPIGFEPLFNPVGTAPGLWLQDSGGNVIVLLPGVPAEMKAIWSAHVVPRLLAVPRRSQVIHRTLRTVGLGESVIQAKLETLTARLPASVQLAFLPAPNQVRLRITATGEDASNAVSELERAIRHRLGAYLYGVGNESLEEVVGDLLRNSSRTIAVAESCTGGMVLHRLTNVPGASDYVKGGIVAYSNEVKRALLGVDQETLLTRGAVSGETARQMAQGVREKLDADIGLAVTGIAGPGGGTPDKPVGLVWIGFSASDKVEAHQRRFGQHRLLNKERCMMGALDIVRRYLFDSEAKGSND